MGGRQVTRKRITLRPSDELRERILADAAHRNVSDADLMLGSYLHSIGEGPLDLCIARVRAEASARPHLPGIASSGGHAKAARRGQP